MGLTTDEAYRVDQIAHAALSLLLLLVCGLQLLALRVAPTLPTCLQQGVMAACAVGAFVESVRSIDLHNRNGRDGSSGVAFAPHASWWVGVNVTALVVACGCAMVYDAMHTLYRSVKLDPPPWCRVSLLLPAASNFVVLNALLSVAVALDANVYRGVALLWLSAVLVLVVGSASVGLWRCHSVVNTSVTSTAHGAGGGLGAIAQNLDTVQRQAKWMCALVVWDSVVLALAGYLLFSAAHVLDGDDGDDGGALEPEYDRDHYAFDPLNWFNVLCLYFTALWGWIPLAFPPCDKLCSELCYPVRVSQPYETSDDAKDSRSPPALPPLPGRLTVGGAVVAGAGAGALEFGQLHPPGGSGGSGGPGLSGGSSGHHGAARRWDAHGRHDPRRGSRGSSMRRAMEEAQALRDQRAAMRAAAVRAAAAAIPSGSVNVLSGGSGKEKKEKGGFGGGVLSGYLRALERAEHHSRRHKHRAPRSGGSAAAAAAASSRRFNFKGASSAAASPGAAAAGGGGGAGLTPGAVGESRKSSSHLDTGTAMSSAAHTPSSSASPKSGGGGGGGAAGDGSGRPRDARFLNPVRQAAGGAGPSGGQALAPAGVSTSDATRHVDNWALRLADENANARRAARAAAGGGGHRASGDSTVSSHGSFLRRTGSGKVVSAPQTPVALPAVAPTNAANAHVAAVAAPTALISPSGGSAAGSVGGASGGASVPVTPSTGAGGSGSSTPAHGSSPPDHRLVRAGSGGSTNAGTGTRAIARGPPTRFASPLDKRLASASGSASAGGGSGAGSAGGGGAGGFVPGLRGGDRDSSGGNMHLMMLPGGPGGIGVLDRRPGSSGGGGSGAAVSVAGTRENSTGDRAGGGGAAAAAATAAATAGAYDSLSPDTRRSQRERGSLTDLKRTRTGTGGRVPRLEKTFSLSTDRTPYETAIAAAASAAAAATSAGVTATATSLASPQSGSAGSSPQPSPPHHTLTSHPQHQHQHQTHPAHALPSPYQSHSPLTPGSSAAAIVPAVPSLSATPSASTAAAGPAPAAASEEARAPRLSLSAAAAAPATAIATAAASVPVRVPVPAASSSTAIAVHSSSQLLLETQSHHSHAPSAAPSVPHTVASILTPDASALSAATSPHSTQTASTAPASSSLSASASAAVPSAAAAHSHPHPHPPFSAPHVTLPSPAAAAGAPSVSVTASPAHQPLVIVPSPPALITSARAPPSSSQRGGGSGPLLPFRERLAPLSVSTPSAVIGAALGSTVDTPASAAATPLRVRITGAQPLPALSVAVPRASPTAGSGSGTATATPLHALSNSPMHLQQPPSLQVTPTAAGAATMAMGSGLPLLNAPPAADMSRFPSPRSPLALGSAAETPVAAVHHHPTHVTVTPPVGIPLLPVQLAAAASGGSGDAGTGTGGQGVQSPLASGSSGGSASSAHLVNSLDSAHGHSAHSVHSTYSVGAGGAGGAGGYTSTPSHVRQPLSAHSVAGTDRSVASSVASGVSGVSAAGGSTASGSGVTAPGGPLYRLASSSAFAASPTGSPAHSNSGSGRLPITRANPSLGTAAPGAPALAAPVGPLPLVKPVSLRAPSATSPPQPFRVAGTGVTVTAGPQPPLLVPALVSSSSSSPSQELSGEPRSPGAPAATTATATASATAGTASQPLPATPVIPSAAPVLAVVVDSGSTGSGGGMSSPVRVSGAPADPTTITRPTPLPPSASGGTALAAAAAAPPPPANASVR